LTGAEMKDYLEQDEAALRSGMFRCRAAALLDRSVTLGVAQPFDSGPAKRARELGIPAYLRTSGGTGLLHLPGDVVWSLVIPRNDPIFGRRFATDYDRWGSGVVAVLKEQGIHAQWTGPPDLSDEYCLLGRRGKVLSVDGRVLGGAAQHLTAHALLHHGVIGFDRAPDLISRLFRVDEEVAEGRLIGVRELRPALSSAELCERLLEHLGRGRIGRPV
jgi:lipoate-protein ligase A